MELRSDGVASFLTPSPIQHLCVRALAPAGCRGPRGERNLTQPLPSWGFPPSVVRQIVGKVSETWMDTRFHHYWLECSGRRSYRTWAGLRTSQTSAGALLEDALDSSFSRVHPSVCPSQMKQKIYVSDLEMRTKRDGAYAG